MNKNLDIDYQFFTNPIQSDQCSKALDGCWHLMPFWVKTIQVQAMYSDEPATIMTVNCRPEYRLMTISVFPGFFQQPKAEQSRMMRHEVIHGLLAPMTGWVRDTLIPLLDEPLQSILLKDFDSRMEGVVQDMSYTLGHVVPYHGSKHEHLGSFSSE